VTLPPVFLHLLFLLHFGGDPLQPEAVVDGLVLLDLPADDRSEFLDEILDPGEDLRGIGGELRQFLAVVFEIHLFDLELDFILDADFQILQNILHDLSLGESLTLRQLIEQTQPGIRSGYWGAPLP